MCTGRTHVRICIETKGQLDQLLKETEAAEMAGHIKRWWEGEDLTIAELVGKLVEREMAHRRRGRQRGHRRAAGQRAHRSITPLTPPSKEELLNGHYDLAGSVDDWGAADRGE